MNTERGPLVSRLGASRALTLQGGTLHFRATGEDTGGAWSLTEVVAPPGFSGPAAHHHQRAAEGYYGLEGHIALRLEGRTVSVGPGDFVLVPAGLAHAFENVGDVPARFLLLAAPAGPERYFEALAGLIAREASWPPIDGSKLARLGQPYDHLELREPA